MKITKDSLIKMIKEELGSVLEMGGPVSPEESSQMLLNDLKGIVNALSVDSMTQTNRETIEGIIAGMPWREAPTAPSPDEDRWAAIERGVAPKRDEETLEEGKCPEGQYWKSFGGQGGTCVKDPDYKGPKSGYSQGGTVSPQGYTPKYEE